MSKKILTLEAQKYLYQSLAEVFQSASEEEILAIITKLGLESILDNTGSLVPVYSMDIRSNRPTYITNDFNIRVSGKVYNYFADISENVVSWEWFRISGNVQEDAVWKQNKNTAILELTQADFTDRIEERDIEFRLKATLNNGFIVEDEILFSSVQTFSKVQIMSTAGVFIDNSPSEITFTTQADYQILEHKWYIDDLFVSADPSYALPYNIVPLKGSVLVKVEAKDLKGDIHTDVMAIPRISGGSPGEPGVPGAPGEDGESTYTWIRYSDSPTGLDMSEYPFKQSGEAREYLGMATNKNSAIESNDPLDYVWTKYIGSDGIPGDNGYMWIKYSKYENGRDTDGDPSMYDEPFIMQAGEREDMIFMGIAYNKESKTEANQNTPEGAPEQYLWAKIKGEDGHTGYILELSNDNVSIPSSSDGGIPNPSIAFSHAKTEATLYYGNDIVPLVEYGIVLTPQNVTYTALDNNTKVQSTGLSVDVGSIKFEAYARGSGGILNMSKKLSTATFTLSKVKNSSAFEIMPSTNVIKVNTSYANSNLPELQPGVILTKILKNTGESTEYITTGRLTYRYLYENTINTDEDGTQITIGNNLTLSNSGNPLFVEFKYFHPITNVLVDRERIPFVKDGVSGNFTEFRYRTTSSSSNVPTLSPAQRTTSDLTSAGWITSIPAIASGAALWAIQAQKRSTGELIGEWSSPFIMTGTPGPPGTSGTGYSIISTNPIQSVAVGSDGRISTNKEYLVTIKVFSNGLELAATNANANPATSNEFLLMLPSSPKTGITVQKQSNNTLKYIIAANTLFDDNAVTSSIIVRITDTLIQMNSNFVIAPIFTAEDLTALDISTTSTVVKYDTAGTLIGPNSITVQAMQQNYSEPITWTTTPSGIAHTQGPDNKTRIYNALNLFAGNRQQVSIRIETQNGLWDQVTIVKVQDGSAGASGLSGTTGPSPRLMEWIAGSTYEIGGQYIDYAYFRTTDENLEGWYIVKQTPGSTTRKTAVANTGAPNLTLFTKVPFTNNAQFGTIIAEEANLAGFIFRNRVLQSQDKSSQICNGVASEYPNLTIDGNQGVIKFLERVHFDKEGIVLKDDCQRSRMKFQWGQDGSPVLQFLGENGELVWEAGQGGYVYIETGTRPSTWGNEITLIRVNALINEDLSMPTQTNTDFGGNLEPTSPTIRTNVENEKINKLLSYQQIDCSGSVGFDTPYKAIFKTNAFGGLNVSNGVYKSALFTKGDMVADINKHNAYYRTTNTVDSSNVPNAPAGTFVPNGWYFLETVSGRNRNNTVICNATIGVSNMLTKYDPNRVDGDPIIGYHLLTIVYIKDGNILKEITNVSSRNWEDFQSGPF